MSNLNLFDQAMDLLSKEDLDDITAAVDSFLARRPEWRNLREDLQMDLAAVNLKCPMDFKKLRQTSGFNRAHDIANIHAYLCRETFELTHSFRPRCAKREEEVPS